MQQAENKHDWVRTFQRKLYRAAKRSSTRRFGILYDKVMREEVLYEAWERVARNDGSAGVDGQTIDWLKNEYGVERLIGEIQEELEAQTYNPNLIRRVYIPKEGSATQRPLGIPVAKDRVIQAAVKLVIEPLFEADFLDCSYGFRPQRSPQQAAQRVHRLSNSHKWFVDLDLKSYFDTIPQSRLLDCVRLRVSDRRILHLIRQWLKAGILEDGEVTVPTAGSPQGGVLSPLLSNIYLHQLDQQWDRRNGTLIRFADDIVIVCKSPRQANVALQWAQGVVAELGLELNEAKTHTGHIREGFDFVGFTYREGISPKTGKLVRVKVPRMKSMKSFRSKVKARLQDTVLGTPISEVVAAVNRQLRGWVNYFKIGQCYSVAVDLMWYVGEQLRLYLRRTHGRKKDRGYKFWPNSFFYRKGLLYAPSLL